MMPNTDIGWDLLHDATLVAVATEWASGETRVRVRLSEASTRDAEVRIKGTTLLRCPRDQPWGPSVSINKASLRSIDGGRKRLEIEVQSGDVIEIEGSALELTIDGEPGADGVP